MQAKKLWQQLADAFDEQESTFFDSTDPDVQREADNNMSALTRVARLMCSPDEFAKFQDGKDA